MTCKSQSLTAKAFLALPKINNMGTIRSSATAQELMAKTLRFYNEKNVEISTLSKQWDELISPMATTPKYKEYTGMLQEAFKKLRSLSPLEYRQMVFGQWDEYLKALRYTLFQKPVTSLDRTLSRLPMEEGGILDTFFLREDGTPDDIAQASFLQTFQKTLQLFEEGGFDTRLIINSLNHGDMIKELLSIGQGHFKTAIAEFVAFKKRDQENIPKWDWEAVVTQSMKEDEGYLNGFYSDSDISRLFQDMMGKQIGSFDLNGMTGAKWFFAGTYNLFSHITRELRAILSPITTLFGLNSIGMTFSSFINGSTLTASRYKSVQEIYNHPITEYLLKEMSLLKGQNVIADDRGVLDQFGQLYSLRAMDAMFSTFQKGIEGTLSGKPLEMATKLNKMGKVFFEGGLHQSWDVFSENISKRIAIWEALWGMGIGNTKAADELLEKLRAWDYSQTYLDNLHLRADMQLADIKAISSISAFGRNKLSSWIFFNWRAGYLINRTAEFQEAFNIMARAVQRGEIKSLGDFIRHLDTNHSLRAAIFNAIYSAKFANYASRFYEDQDDEFREKKLVDYSLGMNDYYTALSSNIATRLIISPFSQTYDTISYMNELGEETTIGNYVETQAYNSASTLLRGFMREWAIVDQTLFTLSGLYKDGLTGDMLWKQLETVWDKISGSAGRYSMEEGQAPFGLRKIAEPDDYFAQALMISTQTNDSFEAYNRFRNLETAERLMKDESFTFFNLLKQAPLLKWLSRETSYSEVVFNTLQDSFDKDPALESLYRGVWDGRVLTPSNTLRIFTDITSLSPMGQSPIEAFGLKFPDEQYKDTFEKKSLFVEKLKESEPIFSQLLSRVDAFERAGKPREAALAEVIAFAEAKVPGSSRIVLSYMAQEQYTKSVQQELAAMGIPNATRKYSDQPIPQERQLELKAAVISNLAPALYSADKISWFNIVQERLKQVNPGLKNILKTDGKNIMNFANAAGFLDMMTYAEIQSGNPNAAAMQNLFAFAGKYVQNPVLRTQLMTNALDTIDSLNQPEELKRIAKIGIVLGNADNLLSIAKDPKVNLRHAAIVNDAINKVYGVSEELINQGSELAIGNLSKAQQGEFYRDFGRNPKQNRYSNSNYDSANALRDFTPRLNSALPQGFRRTNNTSRGYNPFAKYSSFNPTYASANLPNYSWNVTSYGRNLGAATSENIVTWYVNRFNWDSLGDFKFSRNSKAAAYKKSKPVRLKKGRRSYSAPNRPAFGVDVEGE